MATWRRGKQLGGVSNTPTPLGRQLGGRGEEGEGCEYI